MPQAKKSNKLKLLDGNPGKRKIKGQEPEPTLGIPKPPRHLLKAEVRAWEHFGAMLEEVDVITHLDAVALELLAVAYVDFQEARKLARKAGIISLTDKGNKLQSPEVGVANQAWLRVEKMLSNLGMTPAARARVKVNEKGKASTWASPFTR